MLLIWRHAQFRIYWIAGAFGDVSLLTFFTVHGWLTLQISDSPFWVGVAAGIGGLAMTVFAPIGGVIIDRFDKVSAVRAAALLRGVAAAVLATLIFTDRVELWHVLLMPLASGITGSIRMPGMMTLTLDIVGREHLLSATAARMTAMTVVGVAVPLAIGRVVDGVGMGWAYVVMAAGDLLFIGLISFIKVESRRRTEKKSPIEDLKTGVRYSIGSPLVRTLLGVILLNELFGWAHEPMMPVIARDVLGGGASGLGNLIAAGSLGATVSTVALSSFGDIRNKGLILVVGVVGFGFFLLLFSFSRSFPLSMAMLGLAYGTAVAYETVVNTMLQTGVPDEMRGRVMSFQAMMWGVTGMSGFHMGAIASAFGAPLAVGVGAVLVMANGMRLIRTAPRLAAQAETTTPAAD